MKTPKLSKREMVRLIEIGQGGHFASWWFMPKTTDALIGMGLAIRKSGEERMSLTELGQSVLKGLP